MALHPDKIIALDRIANGASPTEREPAPSSTVEQQQLNAAHAGQPPHAQQDPSPIEALAYDLRGAHWAKHLGRLKQNISRSNPAPQQQPHSIQTPPQPTAPAPTIVFQLPPSNIHG